MTDSIYAPPEADVQVPTNEPDYYVVTPGKFFILSLMTMDLYLVYWFYRNWRTIKLRTGESMWPPMRGLFFIFFTHSLFTDVNETIKTKEKTFDWAPATLATLVVGLTVVTNILSRLAENSIGSPTTDLLSMALVPVLPAVMLNAQSAINVASDDPYGMTNAGLTLANWIWIVLGALLWLLALFGIYARLFAPELLAE